MEGNKRRRGRPVSGIPRCRQTCIKMSEEERNSLERLCNITGKPKNQLVNELVKKSLESEESKILSRINSNNHIDNDEIYDY